MEKLRQFCAASFCTGIFLSIISSWITSNPQITDAIYIWTFGNAVGLIVTTITINKDL